MGNDEDGGGGESEYGVDADDAEVVGSQKQKLVQRVSSPGGSSS